MRACFHPDHNLRAKIQRSLSNASSLGRGCLRFSAASCWRSLAVSAQRSQASLCCCQRDAKYSCTAAMLLSAVLHSLLDCFTNLEATNCEISVDEVRLVTQLYRRGKTASEIRAGSAVRSYVGTTGQTTHQCSGFRTQPLISIRIYANIHDLWRVSLAVLVE